jgi:hypothetical protein
MKADEELGLYEEGKVLTTEEVMEGRSSKYGFIDFEKTNLERLPFPKLVEELEMLEVPMPIYKEEKLEEFALSIIPDRTTAGWVDAFGATERVGFIKGFKFSQLRQSQELYTEEDMERAFDVGFQVGYNDEISPSYLTFEEWIKKYKK